MIRAGSVAGLARFTEMTAQPGIEKMATSKSMNRVLLLSLIDYFGVLFIVLRGFMVC